MKASSTVHKILVGVVLCIYTFFFVIMLGFSALCADSDSCDKISTFQKALLIYGLLQWVGYFWAIKKDKSIILTLLAILPLALLVVLNLASL